MTVHYFLQLHRRPYVRSNYNTRVINVRLEQYAQYTRRGFKTLKDVYSWLFHIHIMYILYMFLLRSKTRLALWWHVVRCDDASLVVATQYSCRGDIERVVTTRVVARTFSLSARRIARRDETQVTDHPVSLIIWLSHRETNESVFIAVL